MSCGACDGISLSGLRYDKGGSTGTDRTFCGRLEAAAIYLYSRIVCACCRNMAVSSPEKVHRLDEEVPDGYPAVYDGFLYLPYGTVLSRCASYDLLSIQLVLPPAVYVPDNCILIQNMV